MSGAGGALLLGRTPDAHPARHEGLQVAVPDLLGLDAGQVLRGEQGIDPIGFGPCPLGPLAGEERPPGVIHPVGPPVDGLGVAPQVLSPAHAGELLVEPAAVQVLDVEPSRPDLGLLPLLTALLAFALLARLPLDGFRRGPFDVVEEVRQSVGEAPALPAAQKAGE